MNKCFNLAMEASADTKSGMAHIADTLREQAENHAQVFGLAAVSMRLTLRDDRTIEGIIGSVIDEGDDAYIEPYVFGRPWGEVWGGVMLISKEARVVCEAHGHLLHVTVSYTAAPGMALVASAFSLIGTMMRP